MQVIKDTYEWLTVAYGRKYTPYMDNLSDVQRTIIPLLREEFSELSEAVYANNKQEQLNAIADLMVVSINAPFMVHTPLYVVDRFFENPIHNKLNFEFTVSLLRGAEINLNGCINIVSDFMSGLIEESYQQKKDGFTIAKFLYMMQSVGINLGFTQEEIEEECRKVFLSNMTKFCRTEEDAIRTVEKYKNGTHPNKMGVVIEATYKPTGHEEFPYRIERVSDRKLLKANTFKDVDQF